mmetsp:Transcript_13238/g.41450  ORF Transcript_13238/g.41450 Transcript_13238/m.41450 type:complete len:218 (+) Transcript_13238:1802-2455(+)
MAFSEAHTQRRRFCISSGATMVSTSFMSAVYALSSMRPALSFFLAASTPASASRLSTARGSFLRPLSPSGSAARRFSSCSTAFSSLLRTSSILVPGAGRRAAAGSVTPRPIAVASSGLKMPAPPAEGVPAADPPPADVWLPSGPSGQGVLSLLSRALGVPASGATPALPSAPATLTFFFLPPPFPPPLRFAACMAAAAAAADAAATPTPMDVPDAPR